MTEDAVLVLEIGNERPFFEAAFPTLPGFWLDTSVGEDQVLLVTRQELLAQNNAGKHVATGPETAGTRPFGL